MTLKRIAIIGGGFSGTALSIQLLRQAQSPLEVTLINRSGVMARGLAYGTHSPRHVLNVPAARMSLFPDQPGDFLDYAQSLDARFEGGDFVSRGIYGHYLEQRLHEAVAAAKPGVSYHHVAGHVIDLKQTVDAVVLDTDNGRRLSVDEAVLATGNFTPAIPRPFEPVRDHAAFVRDPWHADALSRLKPQDPLLLVGTGLTMFDVILSLEAKGHQGPLTAISRRGLLPAPHRDRHGAPTEPSLPDALLHAKSARSMLRALRRAVSEYAAEGHDWRDVLAALRSVTPALWQALPLTEQHRFLRHLVPYWDTHRHRAAPSIGSRIQALLDSGRLKVFAGRILDARPDGDGLLVSYRRRGGSEVHRDTFAKVINCTGPQSDVRKLSEPLFRALIARGYIQPDDLGLGLRTDGNYALLDSEDRSSNRLFMMGPMLKAEYWESTAVPELRQHAECLARNLLADVQRSRESA